MKKSIMLMLTIAAGFALTAAEQNKVITFSTVGPDKYADGTTVMDGECYALVKIAAGQTFAGFLANGKAADESTGKVVVTVPLAKNGRCPATMFQITEDSEFFAGDGTWAIYLLDTRVIHDGVTKPAGIGEDGYAKVVNASGAVGETGDNRVVVGKSVSVDAVGTKKPEGIDAEPTIKSIRIEGGKVFVTASIPSPLYRYSLAIGDGDFGFSEGEQVENGKAEDVVFVTEKGEGAQILKVIGK